jgi:hypothetical protein
MSRIIIGAALFVLFANGCDGLTSVTCFDIERDGYFSAKEIPTQVMAPGDTLWINHRQYWSGGGKCDGNGLFYVNNLLANPYEARWIYVNDHYGIIPVKEGEFTVLMSGNAQLTRNHTYVDKHHTYRIRVNVTKAHLFDHPNPTDLKPPFFRFNAFSLNTIRQSYTNGDFSVHFDVNWTPDLFVHRDLNFKGFTYTTLDLDLENGVYFQPGIHNVSLYESKMLVRWSPGDSVRFVSVRVHNPDAWDGDAQKYIPGIVENSGYTFGIRSHQNHLPVEQRTFEVFGY